MKRRAAIDVSKLPEFAFGQRAITWWGVMGFLAIESTMLVICFVSYFYLRTRVTDWPPPPTELPNLFIPTINLAVMLISIVPMYLVNRAAKRLEKRKVLIWTIVCDAIGLSGVRGELQSDIVNQRQDQHNRVLGITDDG